MSVRPPASSRRLFFLAFALLGLCVLGPALANAPRYKAGDFGPHHALTRALARGLAAGRVPGYLAGFSTGSSPFETYPLPSYGVAAGLTLLSGNEAHAPAVLSLMAVLCHVAIAALVARLASRFAPAPLALALGLAALFDVGSFESGAGQTVLEVGLLHNAFAQCLALWAFDLVLGMLARGPRPVAAVRLWLAAGLAAAAHPSGVLFLAPLPLALMFVAAAAKDVEPRRAWAAALHVSVGMLLAAPVWMRLVARTLEHGLHLATPAPPPLAVLNQLASLRWPPTTWPFLLALGYLGIAAWLLRRRAAGFLVATQTLLLLLACTDLPHRLLFDWFPRALARWQGFRFLSLTRPLIFVSAAALLVLVWDAARRRAPRLAARRLAPASAVALAVVGCVATQSSGHPTGLRTLRSLVTAGVPDSIGFEALVAWARAQKSTLASGFVARILWRGPENMGYHVTAESGLPSFGLGDALGMLLREQIEDNSLASLRRFNVRWLAALGQPPGRGEPATEQRFGSYVVRELPEWDGQLARIEKGSGTVRVVTLGDERIEVELTETEAPALVALGIGYYPRWRAQLADGQAVPVFAVPATPQGSVRIVAAWLPPGRTTFSADASLPSDGLGLAPGAVGLGLAALSFASSRSSRRSRERALRALRARRLRFVAGALVLGLVAATLILGAVGRPVDQALRLVPGWQPQAEVAARAPGADWTLCRFAWLRRDFECPGLGRIGDGVAFVLNDHPSSTPFLTPGIVARPEQNRVEYRIRLKRRLEGVHWAASWGPGGAGLTCAGRALALERRKQSLDVHAGPKATECELVLRTRGRAAQGLTLVRRDAVDVDRTRDVPWAPDAPPPRR